MEKFIWKKIKNKDSVKENDCKKFTEQLKHIKLQYFTVIFPCNIVNHGSWQTVFDYSSGQQYRLGTGCRTYSQKKDGKLFGSRDCYVSMKKHNKKKCLLCYQPSLQNQLRGRRGTEKGNQLRQLHEGRKGRKKSLPKDTRVCTSGLTTTTNRFSFPPGH